MEEQEKEQCHLFSLVSIFACSRRSPGREIITQSLNAIPIFF